MFTTIIFFNSINPVYSQFINFCLVQQFEDWEQWNEAALEATLSSQPNMYNNSDDDGDGGGGGGNRDINNSMTSTTMEE